VLLERLELLGFKSFAKRTHLRFSPGITAVVGPNGCGKSNVADAIRWALGEQNVRNLRGKSLEDVIFKGTREAKPAGLAEITLHLDNQDQRLATEFSHVAIQRRAFRTGESEFRINTNPCRLKDIRGLFMDTGLGNAQYAVIEREMIDEVLADRDEARRVLLDETAGITRYKERRKETLRKLEAVEHDLERIEDALEIEERQVRSLAYQMGKARRYRRLSDRIRTLDVALARLKWQELAHATAGSSDRFRAEEREREQFHTRVRGREAEQEQHRLALLELDRELSAARQRYQEVEEELAANRQEVLVRAERKKALAERIVELEERVRSGEANLVAGEQAAAALAPELERVAGQLAEKQRAASEVEQQWRAADAQLRAAREQLARLQQLHIEQVRLASEAEHRLQGLEGRIADLDLQREKARAQEEALGARSGVLGAEIAQLAERRAQLDARREELAGQNEVLSAQREAGDGRLRGVAEAQARLGEEAARVESRLALLEEQARTFDGFGEAVARLLAEREALPGVLGAAAELLIVAPEWSARLAPALRELTEWVVTAGEPEAWGAIEWLRSRGLGQVTFVPLDGLPRPGGAPVLPESALTARREEARPLVEYLRHVIVPVASRQEVAPAAQREPHRRWVTAGGEVLASEGWIGASGGGTVEQQLWTRPDEIASLRERLAAVGAERGRCDDEREATLQRLGHVQREMQAVAEEERALVTELEWLARELLQREAEDRVIREELERVAAEGRQLDERCRDAGTELEALRHDQTRVQADEGSSDEVLRAAYERVERSGSAKDECGQLLSERKMAVVVSEARLTEARQQMTRFQTQIEEAREAIAAGTQGLEAARREIAEIEERTTALRAADGDLVQLLERRREAVDRLTHDRGRREEELGSLERQLRELRRDLSALEENLRHDEVLLARHEAERARLAERIREHYDVDLASLPPLVVRPAAPRGEEAETEPTPVPAAEDPDLVSEAVPAGASPGTLSPAEAAQAAVTAALAAERQGGAGAGGSAEDPFGGQTPAEVERTLEELRRERERLGPVNQLAIEEYEEKREHVTFVKAQRDDLLQSRQSLLDAIERINTEARRLFAETFAQVQENFSTTFATLFPGGEAHLRLSGPDPLEADIEIMARPRGKRLSSINLLSSGERALTATALLFGLYLVKPSPFCVLDELDAPLDDANIDRFLALLKSFSDRTQFVVITHSKRTMEVADSLYGVTMQEPGISKIVSVHLEAGELIAEDSDGQPAVLQGTQATQAAEG